MQSDDGMPILALISLFATIHCLFAAGFKSRATRIGESPTLACKCCGCDKQQSNGCGIIFLHSTLHRLNVGAAFSDAFPSNIRLFSANGYSGLMPRIDTCFARTKGNDIIAISRISGRFHAGRSQWHASNG